MKVFNALSLIAIGAILTFAVMKYGDTQSAHAAPDFIPATTVSASVDGGQIGRFQTFNNIAGVALDTKTGRLCKTYDWHSHSPTNGVKVLIPSPYENQPLCSNSN